MNFAKTFATRVWLTVACSLFMLIALASGCNRNDTATTRTVSPTPPAPARYFKTSFQSESQFVVENIITDIAEMICFARNQQLPDAKLFSVEAEETVATPNAPVYQVTIHLGKSQPIQTSITISGPIWSEQVYADVTATIANAVGLKSPSSSQTEDSTMLANLTDGLAPTIEKENIELSGNLQNDFKNPALHEQAAALLGAFALRENSGSFYDIRMPLCRMTAHLAFARFLAGNHPSDLNGQLADCMLWTLMNNEVGALDQLKKVDTKDRVAATWVRVLRAYANHDFRPLEFSATVTGIERVAWFWNYSYDNNRAVAWEKAGNAVAEIPDYSRIAGAMGYGVEIGNAMLQSWLPLEFQEINQVSKLSQGRELKKSELVTVLNAEPDRCFQIQPKGSPQIRVIGRGLWALQLQHHLCHAIAIDFNSLERKLGVPDSAKEFAQQSEDQFGQLHFYPYVRRLDCTTPEAYRKSTDEGWAFQAEFPHLTPSRWMRTLSGYEPFAPPYRPVSNPHCNEWTIHNPLPGTAYDVDGRLDFPSLTGGFGSGGRQQILAVHEIAPYNLEVNKYIGRTYYKTNWSIEAALSIFGSMADYSATADACIGDAEADQPEQYEKIMEKASAMDPSYYYTLADYEWDKHQTNQAIKAYEKAAEKDPDAVAVASYAPRRIEYYLATGDMENARKTADFAGEVYSYIGLEAKASYLEKTGDLPQALEWYEKIEERYTRTNPVLLFCTRHTQPIGDTAFDEKVSTRLKNWTDSQKKVKLAYFKSPPADGVLIKEDNELINRATLNKGAIVVAVRGIRVHNIDEFIINRDKDLSLELPLIIWQDGSYRELTIILPQSHRLGVAIGEYRSR